jgi:hypothetical protein
MIKEKSLLVAWLVRLIISKEKGDQRHGLSSDYSLAWLVGMGFTAHHAISISLLTSNIHNIAFSIL